MGRGPDKKKAFRKKVDALIQSKGTIDQFVLLTDLVEIFGGPRAMAVSMHEEYNSAPVGGIARQKFWQMVQHLIITSTQMNLTRVRDPSQMKDEEIDEALGEYLERTMSGSLVPTSAAPQEKTKILGLEAADDAGAELD